MKMHYIVTLSVYLVSCSWRIWTSLPISCLLQSLILFPPNIVFILAQPMFPRTLRSMLAELRKITPTRLCHTMLHCRGGIRITYNVSVVWLSVLEVVNKIQFLSHITKIPLFYVFYCKFNFTCHSSIKVRFFRIND